MTSGRNRAQCMSVKFDAQVKKISKSHTKSFIDRRHCSVVWSSRAPKSEVDETSTLIQNRSSAGSSHADRAEGTTLRSLLTSTTRNLDCSQSLHLTPYFVLASLGILCLAYQLVG